MEHLQQNTFWEGKRERSLPERVEQEEPHGFSVQASLPGSTREWDKQLCVRDQAEDQLKWKHGPKTLTEKARLTVMLSMDRCNSVEHMPFKAILIGQGFKLWNEVQKLREKITVGRKKAGERRRGRKYSQEPSTHSMFCGLTHTRDRAPTKQA